MSAPAAAAEAGSAAAAAAPLVPPRWLEWLLPEAWMELQPGGVPLWQWIGIPLCAIASFAVGYLLVHAARLALAPLVRRAIPGLKQGTLRHFLPPVALLFNIGLFYAVVELSGLRLGVTRFFDRLTFALTAIAVSWIAIRIVDLFMRGTEERLRDLGRQEAVAAMPLLRRALKTILALMALLVVLQNFGYNVTGLIAGLGLGGVAIALAAQKTLSNLFGGVSLLTDQPIRVGDFCSWGTRSGTVEEIGLRSTRIRTLDRTLVTVPNSEFSEVQIENFAARDKIRIHSILNLRYETTPDQLRWLLAELRRDLVRHPRIETDTIRVRFVAFGAHSLDVELMAYVLTTEWLDFLRVREDVYLGVMDRVKESGTGFAFPSQTLYLGRDGGLDAERAKSAEEAVGRWRERGGLPFPDLSPEEIEELRDRGFYPPEGSAGDRFDTSSGR